MMRPIMRRALVPLTILATLSVSGCNLGDRPTPDTQTLRATQAPRLTGLVALVEYATTFGAAEEPQLVFSDPVTGQATTRIGFPSSGTIGLRRGQFSADWTQFVDTDHGGGIAVYTMSGQPPRYTVTVHVPPPRTSSADLGRYWNPLFHPRDGRVWAYASAELDPDGLATRPVFSFDPRDPAATTRSEGQRPVHIDDDRWSFDPAGNPRVSQEFSFNASKLVVEGTASGTDVLAARIVTPSSKGYNETLYECPAIARIGDGQFLCYGDQEQYGAVARLTIDLTQNSIMLRRAVPLGSVEVDYVYPSPDRSEAILATTDGFSVSTLDGKSAPRPIPLAWLSPGQLPNVLGWY